MSLTVCHFIEEGVRLETLQGEFRDGEFRDGI